MAVSIRCLSRPLVMLALAGASATAWAQAYSAFSTDTIYGSLQHAESVSFNDTAAKVLNAPENGVITLWTSPLARRTPTTAKLYADGSREQDGMPCRQLHATLERGPNQEKWEFWFRRKGDQWKTLSQTRR